jgi:hypothetical protein
LAKLDQNLSFPSAGILAKVELEIKSSSFTKLDFAVSLSWPLINGVSRLIDRSIGSIASTVSYLHRIAVDSARPIASAFCRESKRVAPLFYWISFTKAPVVERKRARNRAFFPS